MLNVAIIVKWSLDLVVYKHTHTLVSRHLFVGDIFYLEASDSYAISLLASHSFKEEPTLSNVYIPPQNFSYKL